MTKLKELPRFTIIRHRGQQNKATLPDGTEVERQDKLFVPEWGRLIPCADYSEHFIYAMPPKIKNAPSYACSCGSPAVIVGPSGYVLDTSAQGLMFVCLIHATTGGHSNLQSKWI